MSNWIDRLGGYEATKRLKQIREWQAVVRGEVPPGKPMSYYKNKLAGYTDEDIQQLEEKAELHKENRAKGTYTMPDPSKQGLKGAKRKVIQLGGEIWRDQKAVFSLGHVLCDAEYSKVTSPIAQKIVQELQAMGFGSVYIGQPDGSEDNTTMYFNLP